ncbi:ABC transporter permease [Limnohabitans sp. MMS-10A-160]|uniref:ABC transporter permease n=1 Tax=unclassified Limnohabitans TaxID=2626134 RepID=UPI000D3B0844|nr:MULTISPECIES: FtsX-like permease family protein [unclassified Limnohabitans]PUE19647.1 ABC transporter permease [Limnohabitans sp. MMS-10A-192]PUE27008.1 ABC transporter permease [Limnohabitans sp. MMS-10A-160]
MNTQGWMHGLALGARQLWRDLRAGELRLLMLSVALAVAALTAVGFLADRLQNGLWRDARQLLGGDAVVVSDQLTPPDFAQQAKQRGLQTNTNVSFPTMARALPEQGGASRLVALKAVEPGYPLRGRLEVAPSQAAIPPVGEVWVDPALLEALNLQTGQMLGLGDRQLRITATIVREPDRGAGFMSFAPRVMLNAADLPSTGLVQPASRVTWRMAVAGPTPEADRFVQWAKTEIDARPVRGVQIESLDTGRPEMRQTLDRASQFLNLVALLAALLCAVAVALASRSFAERQLDACALLRVLGQSQRTLTLSYGLEFLGAGLIASALGVLIGYGVHLGFVQLLAGLVETQLPAATAWPALMGMGMGLTLLVAFGLPPVLQLAKVPPLRVIRRDLGGLQTHSVLVLAMGLVGFALTLLMVSRSLTLGLITVGGFAVALMVFASLAALALWLLRRTVPGEQAPRWLRLATRQVAARPVFAVVQVSALSVGLLALALLVLLRTDLVASWRQATPANAPDRFVINVQPEQASDFLASLQRAGVQSPDWFPMIRGRLVAINGREVGPNDFVAERAKRLIDREINLSHSADLPTHNPLTAGRWVGGEADGLSVEQGIADTLGLKLGDTLRFDIAGQAREARITSLRKVDWASMRANFFMLFPVAQMPDLPMTYMAAFRSPERSAGFDNALVKQFPNITSVDMRSTLAQVQRVMDQVIRAVEYLFGFTLAAGVMVLLAAVGASRQAREREYAIMRALGASRHLLAQVQRTELLGLGWLAGFMASTMALVVGWALARFAFEFTWGPPLWAPLAGGALGALLAWVAGSLSLSGVLRQPVMQTLRQSTE